MSYTKTTWQDLPNTTTPITATRLNNMENGIKNNDTNIGGEEYSSSSTYAVGDIVRYQEKLYKCITAITTAEAFNSSKWEQNDIIEFLEDGTGAVNTLVTALTTPVSGEGEEIELSNTAKKTFDEFAVEGNTKQGTNLSDGILEQGGISGGIHVEMNSRIRTKNYIKVVPNSDIIVKATATIELEVFIVCYDSSKNFISFINWYDNNTTKSIQSNIEYIRIVLRNKSNPDANITPSQISDFNVGPTPSPYYPSEIKNVGDTGNFTTKVENSNLFDTQKEGWTAVNSASSASIVQSKGKITIYQGTDVTNANFRYDSPPILLKAGTYYVKSNINNSLNTDTARMVVYSLKSKINTDFNTALATISKSISSKSFTLSSDTYISVYLYPYQTSTNVTTTFDKIIISEVNESYVPYLFQEVVFPLAEGQVLHEEDYLADDGIHQKKETIIFDGTETWKTFLSTAGWYYYAGIIDKIKNMTSNNALCSHFVFDGIGNRVSSQITGHFFFNDSGSREITNGNVTFFTGTSSVTEWTTYLANQYSAGTPVTLEYDLIEEIIVPYTDEQKIAYLQLKTLKSYKNKTYISSPDETSPIYTVEAQRDLSNLFS